MKLLTGPPNAGKTALIFGRLTKAMREGKRDVLLILPSSLAGGMVWERLVREAGAAAESGLVKEDFVGDFPRLYSEILFAAKTNRRLIRDISRHRLLRGIVADLADHGDLSYFQLIAGKPGLVDSVASFIDDLWRSGMGADEFARLAEGRGAKDRDLASIFVRYEAALRASRRMDAEGASLYALRALEKAVATQGPGNDRFLESLKKRFSFVAADGFDCYTPVQVKLLALLDKIGIESVATLTYDEDRVVHLWQAPTRRRFADANVDVLKQEAGGAAPIFRVASSLMVDRGRRGEWERAAGQAVIEDGVTPLIEIHSAADRAAEVRMIAREIKRLTTEEGMAYEDISVFCRSLNLYTHHFDRVFREHQIPALIDAALPLCENAAVVSILGLLRLAGDSFLRRPLIDGLRSPYFDWSGFGLDAESIDILERISFDEFITGGRKQWSEAILSPTKVRHEDAASVAEEQRSKRAHLADKLERLFSALTFPTYAGESDYISRINGLIESLQTAERIRQGETAIRDEAAMKAFQDLLTAFLETGDGATGADAESATESRRVAWSSFFEEFERAVFTTSFPRPEPERKNRLVIQESCGQRPRAYRAVFVAGLVEGEFPRKITETSPYTLAEREGLRRAGVDLVESADDSGADLMQFYRAMTRARDRLYLTYPRTDVVAGELLRSYLVDEVGAAALAEAIPVRKVVAKPGAVDRADLLSLEELAQSMARGLDRELASRKRGSTTQVLTEVEAILDSQLKSWAATRRGAAVERRRLGGRERGIFGGFILNEEMVGRLMEKYGEDYLWSASRINDYGKCPFLFFARDVMNLAPVIEPAESFAADRLGDAYHRILERIFGQLKSRDIELSADTLGEAVALSDEIAETVLEEMLEKRQVRKSRLWEFDKRDIKKRVVNLLRAEVEANPDGAAKPLAFEKRFGRHGEPPLVVATAAGEVKFTGIIDRLDEGDEGLVVIDYKTGRTPIHQREAMEGRNLQLPIYLMAASRLGAGDSPVAGGYYLHISSCKRGSEFPKNSISVEEVTERARTHIGEYVTRIRGAEFPVEPTVKDCDGYCPYHVMCRVQSLGGTPYEEGS